MAVYAAVMTGKGTGAIATIQLVGDKAHTVISRIFKPASSKNQVPQVGQVALGAIIDGGNTVDQVTIACEAVDTFVVNCHGNPIVVETIMGLLQRHGVTLMDAEQLLAKMLSTERLATTIEIEAKLAQLKTRTIQGTKLIRNQIRGGLTETAGNWLKNLDRISLDEISIGADQILRQSEFAGLVIHGCMIVLVGPVNTGKSTLLNYLAGREKAIVAGVAGTTRDWVQGQCTIGPLEVTLIDTAGLQETVTCHRDSDIARAAQRKTIEMLEQADILLLVLDNSRPASQITTDVLEMLRSKKTVTVLNKSDLPSAFDIEALPGNLRDAIRISAKFGRGIDDLKRKILRITGVADLGLGAAIAFTSRQQELLRQLADVKSKSEAASIITRLLNGVLPV